MKIIDSFIFYNELDILLYRLTILDPYVDKFVLVESTHTFSGHTKPLYYEQNKEMFNAFADKIVHVVVRDFPFQTPVREDRTWTNEDFQRNAIKRGIDMLTLANDDIILTSDLDEIADPEMVRKIRTGELQYDSFGLNRCQLDMYYYNLNTKIKDPWYGLKLIRYDTYKRLGFSFQDMRTWEWKHPVQIIPKAGWHLSYFGDATRIQSKLKHFSHQEFNYDRYTDLETIENNVKHQRDILFRENFELLKIPVAENPYLPPQYETYLKQYVVY